MIIDITEIKRKLNDRGVATIEMSIIFPVIVMVIVISVMVFIAVCDRETARAALYSDIYQISWLEIEKGSINLERIGGNVDENMIMSKTEVSTLDFDDTISAKTGVSNKVELYVCTSTEFEKCDVDLRRWQAIANITKNAGD